MTALLLWAAVLLPAMGAVLVRLSPRPGTVAAVAGLVAALPAWALLAVAAGGERARSGTVWLPAAELRVGLQLDALSAAMSATVATVGAVVLLYAAGYFTEEPRRASALAGLLGFLAAMQGLVLADGYLPLLFFWELVGAASARLIAFSRTDAGDRGAIRAFLTTRSADAGLYVALLALLAGTGSLAFTDARPAGGLGVLVAVGLIVAAAGKSAQVPLQGWLGGAMAGPTPVSALLHSATMVAAGVYLLIRSAPLLAGWPLVVVGWLGAVTAVVGALVALSQADLKRVLAGSTSSHLGLMLLGLAAGGPAVALFHLVAHAAGKSGLFLAAGLFQHARGTTELDGLRGAGRDDPRSFALFALCGASIAAVPPLAVFWSKDHIVAAAEVRTAWFVLALLAAAGAAAYVLRVALVLAAVEEPSAQRKVPRALKARSTATARGASEKAGTGWALRGGAATVAGRGPMLAALGLAALGSVAVGALGGPLERLLERPPLPTSSLSLALSLLAVTTGAGAVLAWAQVRIARSVSEAGDGPRWWDPARLAALARAATGRADGLAVLPAPVTRRLGGEIDRAERFGLDRLVDGAAAGVRTLSRGTEVAERRALDAAVDASGRAGLVAGRLSDGFERRGVDAAVDGLAVRIGRTGRRTQRLQSGHLHEYLRDAVLGAAALAVLLLLTAIF